MRSQKRNLRCNVPRVSTNHQYIAREPPPPRTPMNGFLTNLYARRIEHANARTALHHLIKRCTWAVGSILALLIAWEALSPASCTLARC